MIKYLKKITNIIRKKKPPCPKSLYNLFKRSFVKQFGNVDWDMVIDFDGYNHDETLMFSLFGFKSFIWVHNDMIQEIKTKGNQNRNILRESYSHADNVCIVSPSLLNPTSQISGRDDNIKVVHNLNDYESVFIKAEECLKINENTNVYNNDIFEVLKKDSFKFINIGRFSPVPSKR